MVKLRLARPGTSVHFKEGIRFDDEHPEFEIPDAEAEPLKASVGYGYLAVVGEAPPGWVVEKPAPSRKPAAAVGTAEVGKGEKGKGGKGGK